MSDLDPATPLVVAHACLGCGTVSSSPTSPSEGPPGRCCTRTRIVALRTETPALRALLETIRAARACLDRATQALEHHLIEEAPALDRSPDPSNHPGDAPPSAHPSPRAEPPTPRDAPLESAGAPPLKASVADRRRPDPTVPRPLRARFARTSHSDRVRSAEPVDDRQQELFERPPRPR